MASTCNFTDFDGARHPDQVRELASALHIALAVELRHIRTRLERMADTLCTDEHFCTVFIDELQGFDLMIQCTDESAAILDRMADGADPHAATSPVRLGQMRERLHSALRGEA